MASVKTVAGRIKMARAHAGEYPGGLPPIVEMVFGIGGTDNNGVPKPLTGNESTLFSEVIRKPIVTSYPVETTIRYTASIDADTDGLVGRSISEAGLYDSEGTLVAVKTFTNKGLDEGTVIEIDYDAEF